MTDWYKEMRAPEPASGGGLAPGGFDWYRELRGGSPPPEPIAAPSVPEASAQPADNPVVATGKWIGRQAVGAYEGVRDAITGDASREFDYPEFPREMIEGWGETKGKMALGRTDDRKLDILKQGLKDKITNAGQDKFGNVWAEYGGQKFYLNRPGITGQDIDDTLTQAIIAMPFAGLAGRAGGAVLGLAGRALGTGTGVAAGSLTQDMIAQGEGATQGPSIPDAIVAGAVGGAAELVGPAVSAIYRRLVGARQLFDSTTGQLTPAGRKVAIKAGIDPDDVSRAWAEQFAKQAKDAVDPVHAARYTDAQTLPVKVPMTRGDISGDPAQQMSESMMRKGAYGNAASATMIGAREQADDALKGNLTAIQGQVARGSPTISANEGGAVAQARLASMRDSLKREVGDLYDVARGTQAGVPGREVLRLAHQAKADLSDFMVSPQLTPKTAAMLDSLDQIAGASVDNREVLVRSIEAWRRQASNMAKGMPDADSTALRKAIASVDRGLSRLIDEDLITGDTAAVGAWKNARAAFEGYARTFKDDNIVSRLVETGPNGKGLAVSPGEATNLIFGRSSLGGNKFGLANDLKMLQKTLPEGEWNAIRQEAFLRLARQADGPMTPDADHAFSGAKFANSLGKAFEDNGEVMRLLFSDEERSVMRQLARVAARSTIRVPGGDNTSNTAVAHANFVQRLIPMLTEMSPQAKATLMAMFKPATNVVQTVRAAGAVNASPAARAVPPGLTGSFGGAAFDDQLRPY